MGVLAGLAVAAYVGIKLFAAKPNARAKAGVASSAPRHEPTLAELTANSAPPKRITRSATRAPTPTAVSPDDQRLTRQSADWADTRNALVGDNRQRAQALREKFPPSAQRDHVPKNASRTVSLAQPLPTVPNDPDSVPHAGPRVAAARGQSEIWNSDRQAVIDANRERAEYLRGKFPPTQSQASDRADGVLAQPAPSVSASYETRSNPADALVALDLGAKAVATPDNAMPPAPSKTASSWESASVRHQSLASQTPATTPTQDAIGLAPAGKSSSNSEDSPGEVDAKPERSLGDFMRLFRRQPEADHFYSAPSGASPKSSSDSHAIPAAPTGFGETRWIKPGEVVEVVGLSLPGGMLYVGPKLKAANGLPEPALISPHLKVASYGDFRERHTNYWPSYADLSPEARRAYLTWLAEGRSHPDCDIGLVFLFFYGLERRVILDSQDDNTAKSDWSAILAEIRRLLVIYGEKSGSFKRYASELLSWVELDGGSNRLYEQPVPEFPRTYELPPYVRLALGQASVDRKPLPAALALSWVRLSPECYLRTAAARCPKEFERLFTQRYHDVLGAGLVLPRNRTKLKFVYQPASGGLSGAKITMGFGDVPDVTALTAPIKKLREIAEQCTDELSSYSRLVGKDPGLANSLEGLLLLPASLWPSETQTRLRELTGRMREGRLALPLRELLAVLGGAKQPVNRERVRGLARTLEGEQIGMEPHVLAGAKVPNESDTVVLFTQPVADASAGSGAEFQTAALTLQLAAAMAQADGDFNTHEVSHLRAEIDGWAHLTPAERCRLHAHLLWLTASPPTLAALKKKLEPLPLSARETVAAFMATLAQSDGFVSPDEVKFLEKVYKALGVEAKRVFSDVHAASAGRSAPISTKQAEKEGFRLDADRIAALQEDTARVSALLSKIFTEEAPPPAPIPEPEVVPAEAQGSPLALDEAHSALLRLMLSRPSWTRAELEDAAADLELMLDGALEHINEAAFDAFDAPLCEGDDPVEVNSELLEKIEA